MLKAMAVAFCLVLVVFDAQAAEYHFYHPDPLGSNTLVTDRSGTVVQRTVTDAYGRIEQTLDANLQSVDPRASGPRHLFTGQEFDPESDLHSYGARHYDPAIGRFLSVDPGLIGARAGVSFRSVLNEPQNLNGHAYVINRPTVFNDPTGKQVAVPLPVLAPCGLPCWVAVGVGAVISGIMTIGGDGGTDEAASTAPLPGAPNPTPTPGLDLPDSVPRTGPTPRGPRMVDPQGNPTHELSEGNLVEFPAKDAHLNTGPDGRIVDFVRPHNTDGCWVGIGCRGEVVIGAGRHRAVGAAEGDTIPGELGGIPDRPGWLRYPLGRRRGIDDVWDPFFRSPESYESNSIGKGGALKRYIDPSGKKVARPVKPQGS